MNQQGLRMAAARLAALHPGDRSWLLEQLPAAHAKALKELLSSGELKQWAAQLGGALTTIPPAAASEAPAMPAPLPSALKSVGPAWVALWLTANAPDALDDHLEGMETWRARRVADEMARFGKPLPPALREALQRWPERQPDSFAEVL